MIQNIETEEELLKSEINKINSDFKNDCDAVAEKCTEEAKPNPMSFSAYSIECSQIWDEKYRLKFDEAQNRLDNLY